MVVVLLLVLLCLCRDTETLPIGRRLLAPTFNVAQTVTLGTPLMFHWDFTDGYDGRQMTVTQNGEAGTGKFISKTGNDWVGLFHAGACTGPGVNNEDRNQCFIAWEYIPPSDKQGTVIFQATKPPKKARPIVMVRYLSPRRADCVRVSGPRLTRTRPPDSSRRGTSTETTQRYQGPLDGWAKATRVTPIWMAHMFQVEDGRATPRSRTSN